MKCNKCGANLSENEIKCPLCQTKTEKEKENVIPFFPDRPAPRVKQEYRGYLFLISLFFLIAGGMVLAIDLMLTEKNGFSFYIISPLLILYAAFVLPRFFRRPNPVIFFPVVFVLTMVSLLHVDLSLDGGWFLSFALPVLGGFFLFLEAAVTLLYYLRGGRLYIFGGLFIAISILSFVGEILYRVTFSLPIAMTWSILPLIFFFVLGMGLIVIAIVPPFRNSFKRKFFF